MEEPRDWEHVLMVCRATLPLSPSSSSPISSLPEKEGEKESSAKHKHE